MDFWKIYRLVYSKRWLIAAIMLLAAAVIYAGALLQGQKKSYQAQAYLQLTERSLPALPGGTTVAPDPHQAVASRVSMVITQLRVGGETVSKAATLVSLPEAERAAEVKQILEENGTFGQIETRVNAGVDDEVQRRVVSSSEAARRKRELVAQFKTEFVNRIARAQDEAGPYAQNGGAPGGLDALVERIRKTVNYEAQSGPLATEDNRDIVPTILVRAVSDRAAEASLLANMVCVAYIDLTLRESRAGYFAQVNRLKQRRNEAKTAANQAQNDLAKFQGRSDVIALGPQKNTADVNVDKFDSQRAQFQAEVTATQATIALIKSLQQKEASRATPGTNGLVETTPLPSNEDPLVRALQAKVDDLQFQANEMLLIKDVKHPDYLDLRDRFNAAQKQLIAAKARPYGTSSRNTVAESLRSQLIAAETRLTDAQKRLQSAKQELQREQARVAKLPDVQNKLYNLNREAKRAQDEYEQYDKAVRQFNLRDLDQNTAGLVSLQGAAAVTPLGTARSPLTLATYGLVLALVFSVALVMAMDALDNSIRASADVEKLLGLPVAGVIPAQLPDPNRAPKITYLDPLSPVAEAYRLLRTDLLFTAEEHPFKSLMCATGKPGQGATTTICNLAIALAQAGKRVILVDGDLRRPRLHNIFVTKNDVGLTSLLQDEAEIEEALKATEVDNLLLLPSGPLPLNPSELLQSPKMRALHERLKPHTDYILFDTPSAVAFSDASVMSSFVDGVLMVVRANSVSRGSELQVKQMLTKARANILGVVLNGMNPEHVDSVHYHYHYYPVLAARTPAGALNGNGHGNGRNGNGHGPKSGGSGDGVGDFDVPLALPEGSSEGGAPVGAGAGRASASAPGRAEAAALEATQTMSLSSASLAAPRTDVVAGQPFLEQRNRSLWRRVKAAVPFVVLAVVVALIVLAVSSTLTQAPTP